VSRPRVCCAFIRAKRRALTRFPRSVNCPLETMRDSHRDLVTHAAALVVAPAPSAASLVARSSARLVLAAGQVLPCAASSRGSGRARYFCAIIFASRRRLRRNRTHSHPQNHASPAGKATSNSPASRCVPTNANGLVPPSRTQTMTCKTFVNNRFPALHRRPPRADLELARAWTNVGQWTNDK